eukprot:COSAG06_NODE_15047_length_1101_cov_1.766467_1_plen_65_part_10
MPNQQKKETSARATHRVLRLVGNQRLEGEAERSRSLKPDANLWPRCARRRLCHERWRKEDHREWS